MPHYNLSRELQMKFEAHRRRTRLHLLKGNFVMQVEISMYIWQGWCIYLYVNAKAKAVFKLNSALCEKMQVNGFGSVMQRGCQRRWPQQKKLGAVMSPLQLSAPQRRRRHCITKLTWKSEIKVRFMFYQKCMFEVCKTKDKVGFAGWLFQCQSVCSPNPH